MAIFSLEPHTSQALTTISPKLTSTEAFLNQDQGPQQSGSTTDGTEKLCSHSAEPGQDYRNAADEQPAVDVTEATRQKSIVAIAGHDPAVLEIWSVTVSVSTFAHVCAASRTCVSDNLVFLPGTQ